MDQEYTGPVPIFVQQPLPVELTCAICYEILLLPTQCKAGHLFCKECILGWLSKQKTCPSCRTKLTKNNLSEGLFVKNVISQLPVKCPDPTCTWTGPYEAAKKHLTVECPAQFVKCRNPECDDASIRRDKAEEHHEKTCPHTKVACRDCAALFTRHAHAKHAGECPQGKVICGECSASFPRIHEAKHFIDECPDRYVICAKCNDWKGPYKNLQLHYAEECPQTEFPCTLCKGVFFRHQEMLHIEQNMASHVFLLMKENAALKSELAEITTSETRELPAEGGYQCFSFRAPDSDSSYASSTAGIRVANGGPLIRFRIERLRIHDHQSFGRWIGVDFPKEPTLVVRGRIWIMFKLFMGSNMNNPVQFEQCIANGLRYDSTGEGGAMYDVSFVDLHLPGYLMPLSNSTYPNSLGPMGRLLVKYYVKFEKAK